MHYVCTGGCKGVTDREGAMCEAKDCSKHDQPLTPCSCTDGQHREAYEREQAQSSGL
jgi:hypothetical protein